MDSSRYTFSDGLRTPWGVWTSGQTASEFDPEVGKVIVRGDVRAQTRTVYRKLGQVVGGAGLTLTDISHVTEFVPVRDAALRPDIEQVRRDVLGPGKPVVSTCLVDGLLRRGAHLEVEVEAVAPAAVGGRMPHALATLMPVRDDGSVVAPGDARSQLEWCLDQAVKKLAADGLQLAAAVVTCQAQAVDDIAAGCGGLPFSCRGVVDVGAAGAAVSVDCLGAPLAAAVAVELPGTSAVGSATRIGEVIHVYGLRCADTVAHPDTVDQASCTYATLRQWLISMWPGAFVLKTVEAVTMAGLAQYRNVADVRRRFLQYPWPVSSGLVYSSLPQPGSKFQVDAVIAVPDQA